MSTKPPFVLHQEKHQHPERSEHQPSGSHHTRLPVIPDLRFEYSYLRSIRPYVKIQPTPGSQKRPGLGNALNEEGYESVDAGEEKDQGLLLVQQQPATEVIQLQWGRIIWITTRDQVISPLLQGALWCVS